MSETAPAVTPRAGRLVVAALAALLPPAFRTRQAGEWLADLADLPRRGDRLRYLVAAAWTLPALRAAVRGGAAGGPVAAPYPVVTIARTLLVGLGYPVLCWLILVPARWYLLDVPALQRANGGVIDPKDLWPDPLYPLYLVLSIGTIIALAGWPLLAITLALGAGIAGPTQRGRTARQANLTVLAGLALVVGGLLTAVALAYMAGSGPGFVIGALGLLSLALVAHRGLGRATRIALGVIGLTAVYCQILAWLPVGRDMVTWFFD